MDPPPRAKEQGSCSVETFFREWEKEICKKEGPGLR